MFTFKARYCLWVKTISMAMVCLFLVNDISWAIPQSHNLSEQTTLAAESRINPFYDRHKIEFMNRAASTMAAMELKDLILVEKAREGNIYEKIELLNESFRENGIKFEIDNPIEEHKFKCSDKTYWCATFRFENDKKVFEVVFLDDHTNLTDDELLELGVIKKDKDGRTIIDERHHLNCPGLEGTWFINLADTSIAMKKESGAEPSDKELLLKLYRNKTHDRVMMMITKWLAARPDGKITKKQIEKRFGELEFKRAEYICKGFYMSVLYEFDLRRDGRIEKVMFIVCMINGEPTNVLVNWGKQSTYECIDNEHFFQLPDKFVAIIARLLAESRTAPIANGKHTDKFILYRPWVYEKGDKKIFEKELSELPIVKEFVFSQLRKRGFNPKITGVWAVSDAIGAAMHRNGAIFKRANATPDELGKFIHEFIHEVYEHLSEEQKVAIKTYFRKQHPEFIQVFRKGRLYGGDLSSYGTEAIAYYLAMALLGSLRDNIDGTDTVLKYDDLDFFVRIGLIDNRMKEKIISNYRSCWPSDIAIGEYPYSPEVANQIKAFLHRINGLSGFQETANAHTENIKYTPRLAANTVLCHITAPSTLPDGQQDMLNRLDSKMRGREYREKILELKTDGSGDFIEQVKDTIQKAQETYKEVYGEDYANYTFKFDVACPSLDLVTRVQNELNLPALAFAPQGGEGNMVQVENIMLALRALERSIETKDIKSLIDAYTFITGNKLSLSIKDITAFAKTMLFAMPKMNVNELGRINAIIEENIKTAA